MIFISLKTAKLLGSYREVRIESVLSAMPPIDEKTIIAYKCDWNPQFLAQICSQKPFAIDLDISTTQGQVDWIKERFPKQKILISYHNFDETPHDLKSVLRMMPQADFYKLACMANSSLDSLRMLQEVNERVIGLCMGKLGQITRILAEYFKAPWNYACLPNEVLAPGQMSVEELQNYNLDAKRLYALIGDPVDKSASHITHNRFNDVLYVKIELKKSEVDEGIALMQTLGFSGASVTMPHKLHFSSDPINTMTFEKEISLKNTDGIAAKYLLGQKVDLAKCKVLILGRGATGRAIFNALRECCKQLDMWNRPDPLPCEHYDVIIQATSAEFKNEPIDFSSLLSSGQTVLEVIGFETQFVKEAKKQGCIVISGSELFAMQAAYQFEHWEQIPLEKGVEQIAQLWHTYRYARSRTK